MVRTERKASFYSAKDAERRRGEKNLYAFALLRNPFFHSKVSRYYQNLVNLIR